MNSAIQIDPEFKALLPALTAEELASLERNIVRDGCREPLTVWNGLLADGHNRHEICTRLGLHFQVHYLDLPDRDAVMLWMLDNQGGRRNLSDIDRIAITTKKEAIIARKAQANKVASGGDRKSEAAKSVLSLVPKAVQPINTRAESAKAAGVGETKYAEGKVILQAVESGEAPPELLDQVRAGEISIKRAANGIREARNRKPAPAPSPVKASAYVMDDAERLWVLAKADLDKILPDDRSRERVLIEAITYCQNRLKRAI